MVVAAAEEGLRVAKEEEDVSAAAAAVVGSSAPILECGFGMGAPPILSVLRPLLVASMPQLFFCTLAVVRQVGQLRNGLFLLLSPLFALSFACPHCVCVCPFSCQCSYYHTARRCRIGDFA